MNVVQKCCSDLVVGNRTFCSYKIRKTEKFQLSVKRHWILIAEAELILIQRSTYQPEENLASRKGLFSVFRKLFQSVVIRGEKGWLLLNVVLVRNA